MTKKCYNNSLYCCPCTKRKSYENL